ncbi:uncharacterized protein LOC144632053 [Oculina patagonica]
MEHGMTKDENGSWEAPLPLRHAVKDLPTSRGNAMKRLKSTRRTLDRKPTMKAQYFAFMQKIFDHDHAELVPAESLNSSKPCWYLPHFGIYHPKKPDKIRVVFDSAAECNGISLNSLLLSGPDLTNGLLGVLLRFRQNPVAMVADIEQMFHSFKVKECHRDLLRFLWYENNDPNGEITEYRMKVHIFGNTSSPAVANYGLRKTAEVGENEFGSDAKAFVHRNFYVDDGLHSAPTTEDAIDLLRRTQTMLATANLRLHKVASSHAEVVEAFPSEDHASGLHNLDFSKGPIPVQQWRYVSTQQNPADLATRLVEAKDLKESTWHTGPKFLYNSDLTTSIQEGNIAAEVLADDPEERSDVKALATKVEPCTSLGSERFSRFSQWSTLQGAVAKLITVAQSHSKARVEEEVPSTLVYEQAKVIILRSVQYEAFRKDIECLKRSEKLPSTSPLANLCPVLDKDGLLRVGGRLNEADISNGERHPLILPKSCHTSELIINHYHCKVQHQGRVFTHGLIRSSGYWIIGGKRMVNSIIDKCLKCKKLRGQRQTQKMADLPVDRVSPAPPFSYVGLDVFGPWQVCARRTRGGLSNAKRWAVLFTCLSSRAIHIEVIESMDTSSFINALRRFLALRGPVIQIRSDCGSNFVGARNELQGVLTPSDVSTTRSYLLKEGCEWVFNPPHASHAGGAWERMIGVTRRVLEAVLADVPSRHLTHEVLITLMAEVSAIVNARPLVPVSSDPDAPEILTPATLLTQKPQQLKQPPGEFNATDLYSKQWKRVQHLANVFWSRWRKNTFRRYSLAESGKTSPATCKRAI